MSTKPNFLIFIIDQIHPDCLGYANHPLIKTPNIDKLSQEGVNFSRTYTTQPLCMPARASLYTGLTPRGHKVRMNGIPLDTSIPTFTQSLTDSGYRTHCCGKIHLSPGADVKGYDMDLFDKFDFPENRNNWLNGTLTDLPYPYYGHESADYSGGCADGTYGPYLDWLKKEHPDKAHLFFDRITLEEPSPASKLFNRNSYKWALPADLHPATWVANKTIDYLNDSKNHKKPFCLISSIQEPHPPFAPPAEYCYKYKAEEIPAPRWRDRELDDMPPHFKAMYEEDIFTSGNSGESMKKTSPYRDECAIHYFGLIELVDDQIGRIMKALVENGLDDNTVVMFLADHGEALGDHGMWSKGPYHYDSVIRVPFIVRYPKKFKQGVVCHEVTSLLDFAPTILDIANVPQPEGFIPNIRETLNAPPAMPGTSLLPTLLGDCNLGDSSALVEMDEDYLGFKLRTLVTKNYRLTCYSGHEYGELFDLENDPDEYYNQWSNPDYDNIKCALKMKLLDKIMQTDISTPRQICRA